MIDPYELATRSLLTQHALPRVRHPREPELPPLSPEEEDSLLSSVTGKVLGGLGYVGGLLDKYTGGRAVRGVLGGHPREALSLLPFSDAIGVTDEQERVSGKDLLANAGLVDRSDDGWGATLGGIAAEIALSPATYMSFGGSALTPAGEAASKIGALPTSTLARIKGLTGPLSATHAARAAEVGINTADILNKPLGGLVGIGLPFSKPMAILGAGKGGERLLEGLGRAGSAVRNAKYIKPVADVAERIGEPIARYGRAWFSPEVAGAFSKEAQAVAPGMMQGVEEGMARLRGHEVDALRAMVAAGLDPADQTLMRTVGELADLPQYAGKTLTPEQQAAYNIHQKLESVSNAMRAENEAIGFKASILHDPEAEHVARHTRYPTRSSKGYGPGSQQTFPIAQSALSAREPPLTNIPGGTVLGYNPLTVDPQISGVVGRLPPGQLPPLADSAALVRQRLWNFTAQDEAELAAAMQAQQAGRALTPAEQQLLQRGEHSQKLAKIVRELDPAYADTGMPYFSNPVTEDWMQTMGATVRQGEAGKAVHQMLANSATDLANAAPGSVPLDGHLLQGMGFTDPTAAQAHLSGLLQQAGKPTADLYVPKAIVSDATRFIQGHTTPAALRPLLSAIDTVTNLTKTYQTAPWLAFHVRNFVSGMWQNFVMGARDTRFGAADPRTWIQPVTDAQTLLRGGTVKGLAELPLFKNMGLTSDEAATEALGKMAYQFRATSHGVHMGHDVVGELPTATEVMGKIPGEVPFEGFGKTALKGVTGLAEPGARNPLGVGGAFGFNKDTFAPIIAGRQAGTAVEDTNRLSAFIGLIRQGVHPEEAALKVRAAHADYLSLAPFERSVMRRLIPFYCVPDDCEILTRRGWLKVDELQVGEDVYALDHDTGEAHWVPCEDKAVFDYDGQLMTMNGELEKFRFTPDHRWPIIRKDELLGERREIVRAYELRSNHSIPRTSVFRDETSVATPREAAIVGWVVTDGYMRRRGQHVEMIIYQSPGKYLDEIVKLLGDGGSPGKPHPDSGVVPVRIIGELRTRIQELIDDKSKIVEFVCRLGKTAALACYEAMQKAEGCSSGGKQRDLSILNSFAQNHGPVLDAFQVLAQLAGDVAHRNPRGANICKIRITKKVSLANIGTEWFKGRVWCPKTKYGTWLMRCNGRVIWTGNTYARKITPWTIEQMLQRPGGLSSSLAKATYSLRQQDEGFVPPWMGGGLAIPLGEEKEGTQRFLSKFDTPPETAFEFLRPSLEGTGTSLLGQTNPLIKAPLEFATGKQMFTGRDLGDLYPVTGSTFADQLLMNSPLSRFITTGRQLGQVASGRKDPLTAAVNLGTGVRISDVDVDKARDIAARELIKERLQGQEGIGRFETIYPRPGMLGSLSPEEVALLRLGKSLDVKAKKRSQASQASQAKNKGAIGVGKKPGS